MVSPPTGNTCPNNPVSLTSDSSWMNIEQSGMEDPSGEDWKLLYRPENVGKQTDTGEIWIKLARDVSMERLYTGGYYRTADFNNGGEYQVSFPLGFNQGEF